MKALIVLAGVALLGALFLGFGAWRSSQITPEQQADRDAIATCRDMQRASMDAPQYVQACMDMEAKYLDRWGEAAP